MASRDRRLYAFAPQADPASVREAALLLLFAFTYLWFAYNRLTDSDGRGLGWKIANKAFSAAVTPVN